MHTLFVYADFNWLAVPMQVGELGYQFLPSHQYTQLDSDIFGYFSNLGAYNNYSMRQWDI